MEIYGHFFPIAELVLFGLLFLTFIYQLYFYFRYISGTLRRNKQETRQQIKFNDAQPPVSVIIAAKNEEDNLRRFLPLVLQQNYPCFEVIVINDASDDDTDIILDELKKSHPNLYTTFVPSGTKNMKSKKLAITLGAKAAKYDILLFTDADCHPESDEWISTMVRNFNPGTEFVLGYGAYIKEKSFINRLITYDTLFIGLQYMGMALAGKPYMGVGRNLAYRKDVFFRTKGFHSSLDILSGDDDLMVNKEGHARNTAVETSKRSITWSEPKRTFKSWFYQKTRHLSASVRYRKATKLQLGLEPVFRGLFYLLIILIAIFGNLISALAAVFLLLVRLAVQLIIINRSSALYDGHKYFLTLPLFDIFLPLVNLFIMATGKSKKNNIRWK